MKLTVKQKKVFDFLIEYTKEHGYPPTVREIGKHFNFLWPAARNYLRILEKKGLIKVNPLISRGIEILDLKTINSITIPIAGRIQAGKPILAQEDIEAKITIDKTLFPYPDAFSLKVKGNSMVDAGIMDGDLVIVKPQKTLQNGQIGVVLIGDEATVKKVFIKDKKVILKPENKNMQPTIHKPEEISIIGKVIGIIRKL
jgi:repressor LexA